MREEVMQYYGFRVGQTVRLRPMSGRPSYFNDEGKMDYLFKERPTFTIKQFTQRHREEAMKYWVEMDCLKSDYEHWVLDVRDIVHLELDNRRIEDDV